MIKNWEDISQYKLNNELNRKELIGGILENDEMECFEVRGRINENFQDVLIKDCVFRKLKIKNAFCFWGGAYFQNTVFDSVKNTEFFISAFNVLNSVVVKGSGLKRFKVHSLPNSFGEVASPWTVDINQDIALMLDISELNAKEVDIRGLLHKKVKWNPEKHVVYLANAHEKVDVSSLDWYFRDLFKYADCFPGDCYIVDYPSSKDRDYNQLVDEIARLKELGAVL